MAGRAHVTHPSGRGRRTLAVAAALAACAAAGGATAQPSAAAQPDLRERVDALVAAGVPGAILLTREGRRTTQIASGLADVERGRAIRATDRFRIASLTKTYTATVVLQLVAERRLSLEDRVEHRLPGLVPGGAGITIRQLLDHTSGLFDFENDPRSLAPYLAGDFGHHWEPRALVEIGVSHPPLFAPGTRYAYSNTNYLIAQLIVERITGRPLGAALERRIFRPLGLRATSYPTTPSIPGRHVHGYLVLDGPPATDVTGISPTLYAGAGAIVSTARDVATFYRSLVGGRLLRPGLLRAMKTTVSVGDAFDVPGQRYGLGLASFPTSCGRAWGHNGTLPGYLVFAYSSANGRRQAVLLVNLDPRSLSPLAVERYFALLETAYCSTR